MLKRSEYEQKMIFMDPRCLNENGRAHFMFVVIKSWLQEGTRVSMEAMVAWES